MEGLPRATLTRLAPTPSGYLHEGNALNFLITEALAKATGAKVLLRIDDLDAARVRLRYVEDIFESLAWLGVHCDLGPGSPADLANEWSQVYRLPRYHALLAGLRAKDLLYACRCSRSRAGSGRYPGHCRHLMLDLDAPDVNWRLALPHKAVVRIPAWPEPTTVDLAAEMGDVVLRQRNGTPSYQVASLADDLYFGTDLVVRGADLLPSTACQLWMAAALGAEAFTRATFVHHPLVSDGAGGKLSKSEGAASLRAMRSLGLDPAGLRDRAMAYLGTMSWRSAGS